MENFNKKILKLIIERKINAQSLMDIDVNALLNGACLVDLNGKFYFDGTEITQGRFNELHKLSTALNIDKTLIVNFNFNGVTEPT